MDKKKREATAQMKHCKVNSLGDLCTNLEKQLRDEEATATKLREQLKLHDKSIKERRAKLTVVKL